MSSTVTSVCSICDQSSERNLFSVLISFDLCALPRVWWRRSCMHLARIWQPNAPAIWGRGAPRRHVQPLQQPHLDGSVPSLLPPKAPGAPARPCSISAVRTIAPPSARILHYVIPAGFVGCRLHTTRYQYNLKLGIRSSELSSESCALYSTVIESTNAIHTMGSRFVSSPQRHTCFV